MLFVPGNFPDETQGYATIFLTEGYTLRNVN